MSNVYVLKLSEVTSSDLDEVKKLGKTDRLIMITERDATMKCYLYPLFHSLKVQPEFISFDCTDDSAMLFFLGLQCAGVSGDFNIIMKNSTLEKMSGITFENGKGNVTINVAASMKDALAFKQQKKVATQNSNEGSKRGRKPKTLDLPSAEKNIESETLSDSSNEIPDMTKEEADKELANLKYPPAPEELKRMLAPKGLTNYADAIAECLRNSQGGVFMSFQIQMQIHLGKEKSEKFCSMLEDEYDELKKLL